MRELRMLLEAGADFAQDDDDGMTALMHASMHGELESMRELIDAGADVEQAAADGTTALMHASMRGDERESMRVLIEAGADVAHLDGGCKTVLIYASIRGRCESMRVLIEAGADVAQADADGMTALMHASTCCQLESMRVLLGAGADVNQAAADGRTALMIAITGELESMRVLIEAGADVDQAAANGITALMLASTIGEFESMRVLIEAGADVAQATANGITALMLVSTRCELESMRVPIEAGADVAQAARDGRTARMIACMNDGHLECARALLEAGANVMHLAHRGMGALDRAGSSSFETLQLLCAYAPSREAVRAHLAPNTRILPTCTRWLDATSRWTSPLHHFEFLPVSSVRALLVEGADVHAADGGADAPTPLSLAAARLLHGDRAGDSHAAATLIVRAAAPWSPLTHALFPAGAKARAIELVRIGWLLARRLQGDVAGTSHVEVAIRDAWLGHVMPHAIERTSVIGLSPTATPHPPPGATRSITTRMCRSLIKLDCSCMEQHYGRPPPRGAFATTRRVRGDRRRNRGDAGGDGIIQGDRVQDIARRATSAKADARARLVGPRRARTRASAARCPGLWPEKRAEGQKAPTSAPSADDGVSGAPLASAQA
jgi:ankyrin repeat protein